MVSQEMNPDKHEFYEIVQNYYRARNHLASAEHDIEVLRRDCIKHQDMVWETKTETMVLQVNITWHIDTMKDFLMFNFLEVFNISVVH